MSETDHKLFKNASWLSPVLVESFQGLTALFPHTFSINILNAGKYGPENLQIRTLFKQWQFV